jgi:hypothetical protein
MIDCCDESFFLCDISFAWPRSTITIIILLCIFQSLKKLLKRAFLLIPCAHFHVFAIEFNLYEQIECHIIFMQLDNKTGGIKRVFTSLIRRKGAIYTLIHALGRC